MPGLAEKRKNLKQHLMDGMDHKSETFYPSNPGQENNNKMFLKRVGTKSSSQVSGSAKKIKTEPADSTEMTCGASNQPSKIKKQEEQVSQLPTNWIKLEKDSTSIPLATPKHEEGVTPINMVPCKASAHFTGRKSEAQRLASALQSQERNQVINVAVTGPPGVGKTELVLKSLDVHADMFDHVLWINGENEKSVQESIKLIAEKLEIINNVDSNEKVIDFKILMNKIYKILSQYKCLIIYDSVFTDIQEYLPCIEIDKSSLFLIVTSQDTEWSCNLQISLDYFTPEISRMFIEKQVDKDLCTDIDVQKLAEICGHIPLALQFALSYIKFHDELHQVDDEHYLIKDFLIQFYTCPETVPNFTYSRKQTMALESIWDTAIKALINADCGKLAQKLLSIMAFMDSENIPSSLFKDLPEIENELEIKKALKLLEKYSFIIYNNNKVSMHKILQNVLRNKCAVKEDTISELLKLFICGDKQRSDLSRLQSNSYIHHAIKAWSYASQYSELVRKFSDVAEAIAASETLPSDETIHFIEKYLKLLESVHGTKSKIILRFQKSYVSILFITGDCKKALKVCDKILSEISNEPKFNNIVSKLLFSKCQILNKLGRSEEEWETCNDLYQRQEIFLGIHHEDTLKTLEAMSKVSGTLNRDKGKQEPMRSCLAVFKHTVKHSEQNQPIILKIANILSQNLLDTDEQNKALKMYDNIYNTFKMKLGRYHKQTLICFLERANCLWKIGQKVAAWKSYNILNLLRLRLNYDDVKSLDLIVEMCKIACLLDLEGNSDALNSCLDYIKKRVKDPKEDSEKTLKSIVIILTHQIKQCEKKLEVLPLYDTLYATLASDRGKSHPLALKVLLEKCLYLCYSVNQLGAGWVTYKLVCQMCGVKPEPRPEDKNTLAKMLDDLGAVIKRKQV